MFKKIAIVMTVGALSLTGCSPAPTAGGDAAPQVSGPASEPAPLSAPAPDAGMPDAAAPDTGTPDAAAPDTGTPSGDAGTPNGDAGAPAEAFVQADATAVPVAAPDSASGQVQAAGPAVTAEAPVAPAPAAQAAAGSAAPATTPAGSAPAAPATDGQQAASVFGWGPVVAGDEFSNTGAPDSTKWSVYNSAGHDGKGARSAAAWSVANGVATVRGDAQGTTGGISAKFARQKYGRWETRMKTSDRDPKYHPVLILWPDTKSSTCAQVDYAEGTQDTSLMKFFLHYSCGGKDFQTRAAHAVDTTQWHNYAVEWTPAGITGYIDGKQTFSDTNPAHQPTESMHQTIQLDWFPDGSPTKPSEMQVDWVRVYK